MLDEIQVRYQGFSPSDSARGDFDRELERLRDEAPSSSSIQASIRRTGRSLTGILQVRSPARTFFASANGSRFDELVRILMARIRRQLERWKATRFRSRRAPPDFAPGAERREARYESQGA